MPLVTSKPDPLTVIVSPAGSSPVVFDTVMPGAAAAGVAVARSAATTVLSTTVVRPLGTRGLANH
jgi:hypothetical protein